MAAFEMAQSAGMGVKIDHDETNYLFGEDQARYLLACDVEQAEALMMAAARENIPVARVGRFGGDDICFGRSQTTLAALESEYKSRFATLFG